jgi:hypothetical protein
VFFAELTAGAGASREEAQVLGEAMLVEARSHAERWDVIGTKDLTSVLDVEASKQAMGCASDSISCASEIADALNAPFLVQGTLGRVGGTWVLTLSRLEQATLANVARAQVQAEGEHADVLLPFLRGAVREVLGVPPPVFVLSPLVFAGAGIGAGAVLVGTGATVALYVLAKREYDAGVAETTDLAARHAHRDAGERYYTGAFVAAGLGGAVVAASAALLVVGVLSSGEVEAPE